MPKTNVLATLH